MTIISRKREEREDLTARTAFMSEVRDFDESVRTVLTYAYYAMHLNRFECAPELRMAFFVYLCRNSDKLVVKLFRCKQDKKTDRGNVRISKEAKKSLSDSNLESLFLVKFTHENVRGEFYYYQKEIEIYEEKVTYEKLIQDEEAFNIFGNYPEDKIFVDNIEIEKETRFDCQTIHDFITDVFFTEAKLNAIIIKKSRKKT